MLTQIESPKPVNRASPISQLKRDSPRFALFALGFRPFYLAAAMFGVLAMAWWWAEFSLGVARPGQLGGLLWHAHEMVFGFAAAVVAGFLLTAAQTWTGVPTPSGWPLAALVAVWAAGRLGMWWYGPATLWLDLLFLPLVAAALLRVLVKAGNRRNYFVVALLAAWVACNAVFHACVNGWLAWPAIAALQAALFILVVLVTAAGG